MELALPSAGVMLYCKPCLAHQVPRRSGLVRLLVGAHQVRAGLLGPWVMVQQSKEEKHDVLPGGDLTQNKLYLASLSNLVQKYTQIESRVPVLLVSLQHLEAPPYTLAHLLTG